MMLETVCVYVCVRVCVCVLPLSSGSFPCNALCLSSVFALTMSCQVAHFFFFLLFEGLASPHKYFMYF